MVQIRLHDRVCLIQDEEPLFQGLIRVMTEVTLISRYGLDLPECTFAKPVVSTCS